MLALECLLVSSLWRVFCITVQNRCSDDRSGVSDVQKLVFVMTGVDVCTINQLDQ